MMASAEIFIAEDFCNSDIFLYKTQWSNNFLFIAKHLCEIRIYFFNPLLET